LLPWPGFFAHLRRVKIASARSHFDVSFAVGACRLWMRKSPRFIAKCRRILGLAQILRPLFQSDDGM
jgi:hypothetical protein